MQTGYIFLVLFAIYAAVTVAIGAVFFKWDIGSIHVRMARRLWVAALAPSVLSLTIGLVICIMGCLHIHPIAYPGNRFVSAACLLAVTLAIVVYFAFDELIQRCLKPGFLRYRDSHARLPR